LLKIIRACLISQDICGGELFFRQTRRIFTGILCVFQENLTQYGGKRAVIRMCFEILNRLLNANANARDCLNKRRSDE